MDKKIGAIKTSQYCANELVRGIENKYAINEIKKRPKRLLTA